MTQITDESASAKNQDRHSAMPMGLPDHAKGAIHAVLDETFPFLILRAARMSVFITSRPALDASLGLG